MEQDNPKLQEAGRLLEAGRFVEAERLLSALVAAHTGFADGWFLLGAARHRSGDAEGALAAFSQTESLAPGHAHAASARAWVLSDLGRHDEALEGYRALARRFPHDAQLEVNAGIVLERLARPLDALEAYDRALARVPGYAPALNNRATVLGMLGREAEAVAASDELVRLHPGVADFHFNRAELLHALGRFDESIEAADRALRIDARHVNALIQKALGLSVLGRLDEAAVVLAHARTIDAVQFGRFRNPYDSVYGDNDKGLDPALVYLQYLYTRQTLCDWSRHGEFIERFAGLVAERLGGPQEIADPRLPFRSLAFPMPEVVRAGLAGAVARVVRAHANLPVSDGGPTRRVSNRSRLRIGYVSPDFRIHPCAYLMQPVMELHDRRRFELYGYALTASDGSDIRRKVELSVDVFRDESTRSDAEIASRITADRIDILVDLAGYTDYSRPGVFARRPGALQVNYLGFPGTLGAAHMDYAIVDREVCPPGAEAHWVEKLVYLPHTYFVASDRYRLDAKLCSRASTALPEGALVLCCFCNAYKIEPVMFSVWMRVLRAVPDAVLWIFSKDARVEENLRREAAARGTDPGRLVFAPYWTNHQRHLGRLRHADVMVDTLHYNGHTTAVDALSAGVPALTCRGASMPSRVAASVLKAMGLPELVTDSVQEYEERLLYLCRNREALADVQRKVLDNYDTTPLFRTRGLVGALESAMEHMAQRSRAGLAPASFAVPAQP